MQREHDPPVPCTMTAAQSGAGTARCVGIPTRPSLLSHSPPVVALGPFATRARQGARVPTRQSPVRGAGVQTAAAIGVIAFIAEQGPGQLRADLGCAPLDDAAWLAAGSGSRSCDRMVRDPRSATGQAVEGRRRICDRATGVDAGLLVRGVLGIARRGEECFPGGALPGLLRRVSLFRRC